MILHTSRSFCVNGALVNVRDERKLPEVSEHANAHMHGRPASTAVMNCAICGDGHQQMESLCPPAQGRAHGAIVDDVAKRHLKSNGAPGTQSIAFGGKVCPLPHDGHKCFWTTKPTTKIDLANLPKAELTSPRPHQPHRIIHGRHLALNQPMVEGCQDCLGSPPAEATRQTLSATTQLVRIAEAETQKIMRDHKKAQLLPLRPHQLNNVFFMDTFFLTVRSFRGFPCFQLFSGRDSGFGHVDCVKKKAQAATVCQDFARNIGAPVCLVSNNAGKETSGRWKQISCDAFAEEHHLEARHHNQNLAELRGGNLKRAVANAMAKAGMPLECWCCALEFVALARTALAKRNLQWECLHEMLCGENPDISVFWFPFWCAVWCCGP